MSSCFGPKIGEDQKKSLRRKISGFLVQMRLETKQNKKKVLTTNQWSYGFTLQYGVAPNGVTPRWCHPGQNKKDSRLELTFQVNYG